MFTKAISCIYLDNASVKILRGQPYGLEVKRQNRETLLPKYNIDVNGTKESNLGPIS